MTTRALAADTDRQTALEDCENKIKMEFKKGLMATCEIARQLHKIFKEELYTVVTSEFSEYVTDFLRIDLRTYRRIIAISQTIDQLKAAGLELPANETQAAELARLDAPLRPTVWNDLVIRAEREDKRLTVDDVRRAVEVAESQIPPVPEPVRSAAVIEVDMEDKDNGAAPPASRKKDKIQEAELVLSEKGEAALTRIRKICGDKIADAIEDGTKALTEREIRAWAEYDDTMMRMLVFFIFDQNYTLGKAVSFLTKEISDSTEVHDLILIASARGGTARINYEGRAQITIELAK